MGGIKRFWNKGWWSKLIIIFVGFFIFSAIINGVISSQGQKSFKEGHEKEVTVQTSPTPTPILTPIPTPKEIPYQTSGAYKIDSETWESIMVSPDVSKEEVIALVKKLHREHRDTHYNIFDDKKELDAWIKWEKSKNDPAVYFPEEWDKEHYVGMINQMLTENGLKWQFTSDKDKYLGTLDLE